MHVYVGVLITLKINSLKTLEVYNTVLLIIVTMLCIRFQILFIL